MAYGEYGGNPGLTIYRLTATTSPQLIGPVVAPGASRGQRVVRVKNPSTNAGAVYVSADPAVTTLTGYEVEPGETQVFGVSESLWLVAGGTVSGICVAIEGDQS